MATGTFRKVNGMAAPVGKTAHEAMSAIPEGKVFVGEFRTARNHEQHDLYWALCEVVADQTDTTKRAASDWLLSKTNTVEMLLHPDGAVQIRPKSIAWESMEQTEFDAFFQRAIPLIADLLRNSPKEVLQVFYDLLDPTTRADTRKRMRKATRKIESAPPTAPADEPALHDHQGERTDARELEHLGRGR